MKTTFRRVVTVTDPDGRSRVLFDDRVAPQLEPLPGFQLCDIWETRLPGDDVTSTVDAADRPYSLCNEAGQMMLKVVVWPQISVLERNPDYAKVLFEQMGETDMARNPGHAAMHQSATTDYVIILDGEITCVLDQGEVTLRKGEMLVQRGTNHGWINRGDRPCVIACVMVSSKRASAEIAPDSMELAAKQRP